MDADANKILQCFVFHNIMKSHQKISKTMVSYGEEKEESLKLCLTYNKTRQ